MKSVGRVILQPVKQQYSSTSGKEFGMTLLEETRRLGFGRRARCIVRMLRSERRGKPARTLGCRSAGSG